MVLPSIGQALNSTISSRARDIVVIMMAATMCATMLGIVLTGCDMAVTGRAIPQWIPTVVGVFVAHLGMVSASGSRPVSQATTITAEPMQP